MKKRLFLPFRFKYSLFFFFLFLSSVSWVIIRYLYPRDFKKNVSVFFYSQDRLLGIGVFHLEGKIPELLFLCSASFKSLKEGKVNMMLNGRKDTLPVKSLFLSSLSWEKHIPVLIKFFPERMHLSEISTKNTSGNLVRVEVKNKILNPMKWYVIKEHLEPDSVWYFTEEGAPPASVLTRPFVYELKKRPDTLFIALQEQGKTFPSHIQYYASGVPAVLVYKKFNLLLSSASPMPLPQSIKALLKVPETLRDSVQKYCFFYVEEESGDDEKEKKVYFRTSCPDIYLLYLYPEKVKITEWLHASR